MILIIFSISCSMSSPSEVRWQMCCLAISTPTLFKASRQRQFDTRFATASSFTNHRFDTPYLSIYTSQIFEHAIFCTVQRVFTSLLLYSLEKPHKACVKYLARSLSMFYIMSSRLGVMISWLRLYWLPLSGSR